MLEDRPCLVLRGYPRSCERENDWACMNYRLDKVEVQTGKRPLEYDGDEEIGVRKLSKQSDACERVETALTLCGISMSPADQSGDTPCLVSRGYPGSCERENDCMNYWPDKVEAQTGKRPSAYDGDEEVCVRKLSKQLDPCERVETALTLCSISLSPADQSGNQRCAGDNSDSGDQPHAGDNSDSSIQHHTADNSDSGDERHAGDNSESSSLIQFQCLGWDILINCLIKCSRSDYGSIACLNRSFRRLIRSGEIYKLRRLHGVIEHWVYFSCQLLEWEAFDPTRRRWMHLPAMNSSNECFMCSDKESLAVGTELLVFGKAVMSHVIYRYSLLTNTWSSGMSMNAPRCLFGSASLGEIAILAGGCDPQGNILSSAELYNSENGTWEALPSMKKPRKMCSGVFMDGKFYVIGGIGGSDSKLLTCGEEYNLETKTWTEIPNMSPVRTGAAGEPEMPPAVEAPPLVAAVNNQLYAADHADMEVRKYDKDRRVWVTVGRLPERADSMNGWGLAFRACGDQLVVIAGPRTANLGFIEINSWVPSEGPPQWDLLGRKQPANFVYNCAVMGC